MTRDEGSTWERARAQLVKQRELVIEALAKGYEDQTIDQLLKIQAAIDVLDSAGDDEEAGLFNAL